MSAARPSRPAAAGGSAQTLGRISLALATSGTARRTRIPTGLESALVKPVVDGIIALFKKAKSAKLKATAEKALGEAIRELLLAPSNLRSAETKIAVAKAAGIINTDLVLAEEMLQKHQVAKKAPAKKAAAKKAAAKKAAAKKARAKKAKAKRA